MSAYSPSGRGARMLRHLADHGSTSFSELLLIIRSPANRKRRQYKVDRILHALTDDGFVTVERRASRIFTITPAGLDALAALEAGHEVSSPEGKPHVRIFLERAA